MEKIQKYSKRLSYSYTLGAFPTWELINTMPEIIKKVYISDEFEHKREMIEKLDSLSIRYEINKKLIEKLSPKGNVYVVAIFDKFQKKIVPNNHIVLNEVSDMGNLGTIIRTMIGFGMKDLAIIGNSCDIFNPKVIRASMGAIFRIRFSFYENVESYIKEFKNNIYLFMLSKNEEDSIYSLKKKIPYSIVMGNEGSGLPEYFSDFGRKVFIPQSVEIDSFNLPIATAIGIYEFGRENEITDI